MHSVITSFSGSLASGWLMRISQQGAVAFQFLALSFVVTIPYATFESYFGKGAWFLLFLLQGLITCHKGRLLFVGLALIVLVEGLKHALSARRGLFGWPRNIGSRQYM